MVDFTNFFLTLGLLFFVGLMTDLIGRNTWLPRVSLLMVFGFIAGPSVLDIIPEVGHRWFPAVADMALVMIGFLLGGQLTIPFLKKSGRHVLGISLFEVIITAALVTLGMLIVGMSLPAALLLGAIAPATAPAATVDVVKETHAEGPFTDVLLGVVGIDDIWGVVFFTVVLSMTMALSGGQGASVILLTGLWDVAGAIILGVLMGIPMAFLTGRVKPGEPTLVEALGFVFLCAGIAFWMEVSFILSSMAMGSVVANLAKHHARPFHAVEGIEWPFLTLFFVLSGASLHLKAIFTAGSVFLIYVCLRVLGKFLGSNIGAKWSGADKMVCRHMWMGLMPQAGIALGMALYACQRFQDLNNIIMPVVIGGTIVFELFGPIMTKRALIASGDVSINR
ncbi:MAG: cation:proton antiporter [Deltaproteobacteria bacterium]|jgi:Kef-type K+ transport system membrane component KefB|nr:cation:proton antiporter [Deltaproteobacteria bacterium]